MGFLVFFACLLTLVLTGVSVLVAWHIYLTICIKQVELRRLRETLPPKTSLGGRSVPPSHFIRGPLDG